MLFEDDPIKNKLITTPDGCWISHAQFRLFINCPEGLKDVKIFQTMVEDGEAVTNTRFYAYYIECAYYNLLSEVIENDHHLSEP